MTINPTQVLNKAFFISTGNGGRTGRLRPSSPPKVTSLAENVCSSYIDVPIRQAVSLGLCWLSAPFNKRHIIILNSVHPSGRMFTVSNVQTLLSSRSAELEGGRQRRQSGLKSGESRGFGLKNYDFFLQISEKFQFFSGNFTKEISIFRQEFPNYLFLSKISIQPDKIGHLRLLLAKLFYFSSKLDTFQHTSCT